jgi:hypothetical protein
MKALENGDSSGAIMHLTAADQALGWRLETTTNLILQTLFFNFLQNKR